MSRRTTLKLALGGRLRRRRRGIDKLLDPDLKLRGRSCMALFMDAAPRRSRLASLDQFRGYIVVGMLLANFSGEFGLWERVIGHGAGFFNWADSIMPGFLFCAGVSFRLTAVRRMAESGRWLAWRGYVRRSVILVGLSLAMYGLGVAADQGRPWAGKPVSEILFELLKADLWEVLSIIGVSQLLLLPVIDRPARVRWVTAAGLFLGYIVVNGLFAYNFQQGLDNWLNGYFGAHDRRSWDGGMVGVMAWAVPMAAGSLAADALTGERAASVPRRLVAIGAACLVAGYAVSCLTTLYDRVPSAVGAPVASLPRDAVDPVWPRAERWHSPGLRLAEPPFVPPPSVEARQLNFWMMSKRIVSPSFNLFSLGFTLMVFSGFIFACDIGGRQWRLFSLFGQNPLAAYLLHLAVLHLLGAALSERSLPTIPLLGLFAGYFAFCAGVLRLLEARRLYVRL